MGCSFSGQEENTTARKGLEETQAVQRNSRLLRMSTAQPCVVTVCVCSFHCLPGTGLIFTVKIFNQKVIFLDHPYISLGKSIYSQAQQPKVYPWDPHGEKSSLTPVSYVSSSSVSQHTILPTEHTNDCIIFKNMLKVIFYILL